MVGLLACGSADSGSGGLGGSGGVGGSPSERRVFVTSTVQTAALGGIAGADALCATQADEAGLGRNFKAWLSTTLSSVADADRLSQNGGPFVRVDEVIVANDWADLVDGALLAPISLDATGQASAGDVWTGTLPNGDSYTFDDCAAFTSESGTAGQALCGNSTSTSTTWTDNQPARCSSTLRLYCIEQ
jgi:hypothetical protein